MADCILVGNRTSGGGSGGSPVETVLYDNTNLAVESVVNAQFNLSQPYTDFDEIRIEYAYIYTGSEGNGKIYPAEYRYSVADLETMRTSLYNGRKGYLLPNVYLTFASMYISLDITSTSNLTIVETQKSSNNYKQYITKITGVKYSGSSPSILLLKSVSWTGTGTATNNITFTEKPTLILSIQFTNKSTSNAGILPFRYGNPSMFCTWTANNSSWSGTYCSALSYSQDELTMTITGTDKGSAWNDETTEYILYYM